MTPSPVPAQSPRVLLTRPAGSNERLAEALTQRGIDVRIAPVLNIRSAELSEHDREHLIHLDRFSDLICTSQHAARAFLDLASDWWPQWPVQQRCWCLGTKTRQLLENAGFRVRQPGAGHTSEALLDAINHLQESLPHDTRPDSGEEWPLTRVLLLSGEGGRETLQQQLSAAGYAVEKLALYSRETIPPERWAHLLEGWQADLVLALSGETLHQLVALSHNTGHSFSDATVLVPSERVADLARPYFGTVRVLTQPDHEGQLAAICQTFGIKR